MANKPYKRRRLRVYVAGPISKGDIFENVTRGLRWGRKMAYDGLAPFIPQFDVFLFMGDEHGGSPAALSWGAYLEWDIEWAMTADAIFRVTGDSKGADLECEKALEHGIPVFAEDGSGRFGGYDQLLEYAKAKNLAGGEGY